MSVAEHLRAALRLIDRPQKWTRETYARASDGIPVDIGDVKACRFCASGAVRRVSPTMQDASLALNALSRAVRGSITQYNDLHSHRDVVKIFLMAIKEGEEESC